MAGIDGTSDAYADNSQRAKQAQHELEKRVDMGIKRRLGEAFNLYKTLFPDEGPYPSFSAFVDRLVFVEQGLKNKDISQADKVSFLNYLKNKIDQLENKGNEANLFPYKEEILGRIEKISTKYIIQPSPMDRAS